MPTLEQRITELKSLHQITLRRAKVSNEASYWKMVDEYAAQIRHLEEQEFRNVIEEEYGTPRKWVPHLSNQEIAEKIALFVNRHKLNDPRGGVVTLEEPEGKNPFHLVTFMRGSTADGGVRIYNSGFILIKYQTSQRGLPRWGKHIVDDFKVAIDFLLLAFVEHKSVEALMIVKKHHVGQ